MALGRMSNITDCIYFVNNKKSSFNEQVSVKSIHPAVVRYASTRIEIAWLCGSEFGIYSLIIWMRYILIK